jgi:hypothetical protein
VPNLELKQRQVDELADQLQQAELTVLADYRGLTVAEMSRLRGRLRDAGAEFHVAKNTLTRRAAERLGYGDLVPYLVGPSDGAGHGQRSGSAGEGAAGVRPHSAHVRAKGRPARQPHPAAS